MKIYSGIAYITALFIFLFVNSCANTSITGSWKDAEFTKKAQKTMVLMISQKEVFQKIYESEFVNQLKNQGIMAIPSYTVLPVDQKLEKAEILKKARQEGIDAILVTKIVSQKTEKERVTDISSDTRYYGGPSGRMDRSYPRGGWYGDYHSSNATVRSYDIEYQIVDLETSLYDLESEKMVWSVITQTTAMESSQHEIQKFIKVIVDKLIEDSMI